MYTQGTNASFDLCNSVSPQSYSNLVIEQNAVEENELINLGQINAFLNGNLNFTIKDITPVGNFPGLASTDDFMFQKYIQVRCTVTDATGFSNAVSPNNIILTVTGANPATVIFGNVTISTLRESDLFLFNDSDFDAFNFGQGVYKLEQVDTVGADIVITFSPYILQKRSINYLATDPLRFDTPLNDNSRLLIITYEGTNGGRIYQYVDSANDGLNTDVPFIEVTAEKRLEGLVPTNYLFGAQFPNFLNKISDIPEGYDFYYLNPPTPDPGLMTNNNNVYKFIHDLQQSNDYVSEFNQLKSFINTNPTNVAILDFTQSSLRPYFIQYTQTTLTMNGVNPNQQCVNFLKIDTIELDPGTRLTLRRVEDSCVFFIEGFTGDINTGTPVVRLNFAPI